MAAFWTLRGSPERQGEIFICTPTPTVLREPLPDFGLILRSGDPRLADEQVQGLWLCHHDQLRGGSCCHPGGSETQVVASILSKFPFSVPQRLHSWQQGSSGLVQNQQQEGLRFQPH